ncbi:hypothetical protein BO79DRAFT_250492 [Aspergillus costaricaensis CBS 115574]|uniref:Uncharacterized protein n=1 Tax=Aspergillus costaricaensis CBS 115574 TaxID=1448317 RepID=A0ACD1IU51_9EURO|nr:hypothetical protein BO79DRAFT_250492 [Aspergillus costaricaensis CBS 115574]RAK93866.1 hypothetical protein BO79DRAFT_250492 [Aspergillus costaricaensis CBS 115574]
MSFLATLFLVFFAPFLLLLGFSRFIAPRLRSYFSASPAGPGLDSYGRDYLRSMVNTGSAMSEQIELQNMLDVSDHEE